MSTDTLYTNICKFSEALSKAQAKMEPAEKSNTNPFFKSKYADYKSIWDAVKIPLTENGFSVVHRTEIDSAGNIILITDLCHLSGTKLSSTFPIRPSKANDMQAVGSAITYAKRYNLAALTAVPVADEDDDGESAVDHGVKCFSSSQIKFVEDLLKQLPSIETQNILKYNKVKSIPEIAIDKFDAIVSYLNSKVDKQKEKVHAIG
jgi:hypothetical protein